MDTGEAASNAKGRAADDGGGRKAGMRLFVHALHRASGTSTSSTTGWFAVGGVRLPATFRLLPFLATLVEVRWQWGTWLRRRRHRT